MDWLVLLNNFLYNFCMLAGVGAIAMCLALGSAVVKLQKKVQMLECKVNKDE